MKNLLFVCLLLLISTSIFSQSVSYNEEFQVNTYVENNQWNPNVKGISNGGFVVSWSSFGQFTRFWNVSIQIYDNNGGKIGNEIIIKPQTDEGSITLESLSAFNDDGFIISYSKETKGIFAQKFTNNAEKNGHEIEIISNNLSYGSSISSLEDNGFVVCYRKLNEQFEVDGIYCKIFNINGEILVDEFKVSVKNSSTFQFPRIISLEDGGFIISWQSQVTGWGKYLVYFKVYDNQGIAVSDEVKVSDIHGHWHSNHQISKLGSNKFIVVWDGINTDEDIEYIYARFFNNDGSEVSQEIPIKKKEFNERFPVVKGLSNDEFIVCWESWQQDGSGSGIYSQMFDNNGIKKGNEFQVNTYTNNYQDLPNIGKLTNGGFVVCWISRGQDGSGYGVFGKYYLGGPIDHDLKSFELLEPKFDVTLNHANPQFTWNNVTQTHINFQWEINYDLYIDSDASFSNPLVINGIEDTTYQIDSLTPGNTYFWKILAKNISGEFLWSSNVNGFYINENATDVEIVDTQLPEQFELFQNYPNPFNPTTNIAYSLPVGQSNYHVIIKTYDVLGRVVKELVNENQQSGNYEVEFNATNLTSGIYFYSVQAGEFSVTKKMLLMR